MRGVPHGTHQVLQSHRPLRECLEWRLSLSYWDVRGPAAFLSGEVPNLGINDGRLAEDVARVLEESAPALGPVRILELGGGGGLFAKLLLDAVRRRNDPLYRRIHYLLTDGSPTMLRQSRESGLFAEHGGRVDWQVLDASQPRLTGPRLGDGFDLIVANYLLDNLACDCLFLRGSQLLQLTVEAVVPAALDLEAVTGLRREELRRVLDDPRATHPALVSLHPHVVFRGKYEPVERSDLRWSRALPLNGPVPRGVYWPHSHGALDCLRDACALLRPDGAILVNDYGYRPWSHGQHFQPQVYGGSLAVGLNFDELDAFGELVPGWRVLAPASDSGELMSRWITRDTAHPRAGQLFTTRFDGPARDRVPQLLEEAQTLMNAPDAAGALRCLEEALQACPLSWSTLERLAEFHLRHTPDEGRSCIDCARRGLALHPLSSRLRTLLAEGLRSQGRTGEAEAEFRRATEGNDRDARPWLGLARLHLDRSDWPETLRLIGEGLRRDGPPQARAALLELQADCLAWVDEERESRRKARQRRYQNLRSAHHPRD